VSNTAHQTTPESHVSLDILEPPLLACRLLGAVACVDGATQMTERRLE
jgi:hypothetical protein